MTPRLAWIALALTHVACGSRERRAAPIVSASATATPSSALAEALPAAPSVAPTAPVAESASLAATSIASPRIASVGAVTWIHAGLSRARRIGYVRAGTSVALRGPVEPTRTPDCKKGFYDVEPRGAVCLDDAATLDLDSTRFRALAAVAARDDAAPFRYGFSTRAPVYARPPTAAEQLRAERRLRPVERLGEVRRSTAGHEDLAELEPAPADSTVDDRLFGLDGEAWAAKKSSAKREAPYGSMIAWGRVIDLGGRAFLVTPELGLVPADRVRPFRASSFHGVEVDAAHPLPLAWLRRSAPRFRRDASGALREDGAFDARTCVSVLEGEVVRAGVAYLEARERGVFVRASDASLVRAPERAPAEVGPDETWIDVSLAAGTLTVLVGARSIYSTLVSPGAGGVTPSPSLDDAELLAHAYTPRGTFRVAVKHRATRMAREGAADDDGASIADVPSVQYFRPPFAIHAAYWHESFGLPKSGGCLNLSPIDAARVFAMTEPRVPEGWAGVMTTAAREGSVIVIHR